LESVSEATQPDGSIPLLQISRNKKCPEGVKACSLGAGAVCQPQVNANLQNPKAPKGRRQIFLDESNEMNHLVLEPRAPRNRQIARNVNSAKSLSPGGMSCRRPFGALAFLGDSRLPWAGKKRQPRATCLSSFGAKTVDYPRSSRRRVVLSGRSRF